MQISHCGMELNTFQIKKTRVSPGYLFGRIRVIN